MRHSILVSLIALQIDRSRLRPGRVEAPKLVGGGCDGCELMFEGMPKELELADHGRGREGGGDAARRPGRDLPERRQDARPRRDPVRLPDRLRGAYSPAAGQVQGRRHGRLRGWMKTGADGRYEFRTIRPAPYPGQAIPAHIHPVIKEPDKNEYYLDEFVFDDDPLLTKEKRAGLEGRGGSGVMKVTEDEKGVATGRRDIVLGRNIPNYD